MELSNRVYLRIVLLYLKCTKYTILIGADFMNKMSLIDLKDHQEAVVVDIAGGLSARKRLENMGVRIGQYVTKISGVSGPVVIKMGNSQIAIGRGIASKIVVRKK